MPTSSSTSKQHPRPRDHAQLNLTNLRHAGPVISIFDIPLIVDEIFRSLSLHNLRICQRVCKHWSALCRPGIWRLVSLYNQRTTDAQRGLILQNAHWIRSLSVEFWDTRLVDGELCRGLHELIIWGHAREAGHLQQEAPLTKTTTSWDLIGRNPALRSLSLEFTELLLPQLTTARLDSVLYSTLRVMTIDVSVRLLSSLPIITLLCHCPDTLQELSLTNTSAKFWTTPTKVTCPANAAVTMPARWRALQSLRSLRVECQVVANLWIEILHPLLRHCCPQLRQLTLGYLTQRFSPSYADVLVSSCPFLVDLEIPDVDLDDQEMLHIVQSYVGLQRVSIGFKPRMLDQVIPTLIRFSGSSLTRVHIVEQYGAQRVESVMPLYPILFLENCPHLVSLIIRPLYYYLRGGLEGCLRALVERNGKDSQWASPSLETLALRCLVPLGLPMMGRRAAVIVKLAERLCVKLRDQKRLKSIRMGRVTTSLQLPVVNADEDDAVQVQAMMDKREEMIRKYLISP